jgi:hypothetical protein
MYMFVYVCVIDSKLAESRTQIDTTRIPPPPSLSVLPNKGKTIP